MATGFSRIYFWVWPLPPISYIIDNYDYLPYFLILGFVKISGSSWWESVKGPGCSFEEM